MIFVLWCSFVHIYILLINMWHYNKLSFILSYLCILSIYSYSMTAILIVAQNEKKKTLLRTWTRSFLQIYSLNCMMFSTWIFFFIFQLTVIRNQYTSRQPYYVWISWHVDIVWTIIFFPTKTFHISNRNFWIGNKYMYEISIILY